MTRKYEARFEESHLGLDGLRQLIVSKMPLKDIANKLDVSLPYASILISEKFGKSYLEIKNERFNEELIRLARSGISLQEISNKLGCCASHASLLIKKRLGRSYDDLRKEDLKEELEKILTKRRYVFEVRKQFDYSPHSFYGIVSELGMDNIFREEKPFTELALLKLKESLNERGIPYLDLLIERGYSEPFISKLLSLSDETRCTNQFVDQYIKGSGQYILWKESRERRKGKKKS